MQSVNNCVLHGVQWKAKSERYLPKKPSSCPPRVFCVAVPPGYFWKQNLAGKFASFDQLVLWGSSLLFAVQETEWCKQGEAHSIPPSLSTHADVLGDMGLGFTLVPITLRYHISSIRCRGYYVFCCSFCAATIQGWLLFEVGYYSRAAFISLESPETSTTAG